MTPPKNSMAFHLTDRWGKTYSHPSIETLRQVLATRNIEDQEHPDVSLAHESGWCLSAFFNGLLVWENAEEQSEGRHMARVPREKVLELWQALAHGDLERVEAEAWVAGYGMNGGVSRKPVHRNSAFAPGTMHCLCTACRHRTCLEFSAKA